MLRKRDPARYPASFSATLKIDSGRGKGTLKQIEKFFEKNARNIFILEKFSQHLRPQFGNKPDGRQIKVFGKILFQLRKESEYLLNYSIYRNILNLEKTPAFDPREDNIIYFIKLK